MTTSHPRRHPPTPRPALHAASAVVLLAALAAACAGDDGPAPGAVARDTAPAAVDSAAEHGGAGDAAADTAPPAPAAGEQEEWVRPPLRGTPEGSRRGVAVLTGVRTGRHPGYDRIVFEFRNHLPEYTVRFVQDAIACGSGERVDPGGATALEVDLRPAAAHDDEGRPTIEARVQRPGLPALRTARITCDFEAIVTWILGLDHRASVRTLELTAPPRLVVDVRHR